MEKKKKLNLIKERRQKRVRMKIRGTSDKPRLSVFRSHQHIYAQLIDDGSGKTIVAASSFEIKEKLKKAEMAKRIGNLIAEKAKKVGIGAVVFDRGRYRYHGRVQALAEGARDGGLKV